MNEGNIEQIGTPEEVYERPATPFVYGFLGNVNKLHGHVDNGKLYVGAASFEAPDYHPSGNDNPAVTYVRPQELDIERESPDGSGISVRLGRALIVGPTARVEFRRNDNAQTIEAELPAHRYRALNLKPGESLWVRPRKVRVFAESRQNH